MTQNKIQIMLDVEQSMDVDEPKELNEEEAEKHILANLLIRNLEKIGDNPIYRPHSKRINTYVIVHKNLHDSLKRFAPFYTEDNTCTSPEMDLCRKVFKAVLPQHILADRQTDFWHKSQSDLVAISPQNSVLKAEVINELCHQLSYAIANDETYKNEIRSRKEKSLHQKKQASWVIKKLFNRFSKLLVLRIDFSINRNFKITLELLKTYIRIFLKKLHAPNEEIPPIVGYIWKLEYGIQKGYHYHFIFFMNGNIHDSDIFFAYKLTKLWMRVTQDKGFFHSCNDDKASYEKLAIGILVHNDHEKINTLNEVIINYLTKTSQFIIEKIQVGQRAFGYSTRKLEKSKVGRPRKINAGSISV
jgi:hypothetical protein